MQEDYEKIYEKVASVSNKIVNIQQLNSYVACLNENEMQALIVENSKKEKCIADFEKQNHKMEEYIKKLEEERVQLQTEENKKAEYIKVLENANKQKDKTIETQNRELKSQNETIDYYENMRVIKWRQKIKCRCSIHKKKGNL